MPKIMLIIRYQLLEVWKLTIYLLMAYSIILQAKIILVCDSTVTVMTKRTTLIMALLSSLFTFSLLLFWLLPLWSSMLSSILSLLLAITIAIAIYFNVSHFANLTHFKCLVTLYRWLHTCWPHCLFISVKYLRFLAVFAFYWHFFKKSKKKEEKLWIA